MIQNRDHRDEGNAKIISLGVKHVQLSICNISDSYSSHLPILWESKVTIVENTSLDQP